MVSVGGAEDATEAAPAGTAAGVLFGAEEAFCCDAETVDIASAGFIPSGSGDAVDKGRGLFGAVVLR